jgi:serine/tyrosine/threonine adenylyltransferase
MPPSPLYRAAPRITELGDAFYDPVAPARFPMERLRFRNERWAARVGLGALSEAEWQASFARFEPLPDNLSVPLALRYHGHQFMSYNPNLGDGRGFLHAQLRDGCDGRLLDLGTKGTGRTPYSRGGDGRLTLKGGFREVLATEMLEALGVNTSKSFSLFETGEKLERGDEPSPTRASVLVRLSHSHLRIGTFQRFAWLRDADALHVLLEYGIRHFYPALAGEAEPVEAFVTAVSRASARLCAAWMAAGFVHGVLNSDNINVTGESFDYGPYRFLPHFDPLFTAAYFDSGGLYAFGRQPTAMRWNVEQLGKALTPIATRDLAPIAERAFDDEMAGALPAAVVSRLGLVPAGQARDAEVLRRAFDFLESSRVGYDAFYFDWYGGEASAARALASPRASHYQGEAMRRLRDAWSLHQPTARLADAYFARPSPCSLLIDEIEALWSAIAERDDWEPFERKIADIRTMGRAHGRDMVPAPAGG